MKILFVSPRYYPAVGGVEYVVKSVAERLAKRGFEVGVLCGEPNIEKPVEEFINEVRVTRWPIYAPNDAYYIPRTMSSLKEWLSESARDVGVVHFHSVHSVFTVYALNVLKNRDVYKVLTPYYHGTGHTLFRRVLWKGWRYFIKALVSSVDVIHTVSRFEAKLVKRDFKVDATPIENGVDEWILNMKWSPSGYVMYSGRIEKYKNIHRLANIVKILNKGHGLNLELRVYGSGPFTSTLINHLRKIGIKFSVKPSQPFEKYVESLSKATLFGLLSEKESYPQSVNEANAIGVPVVVARPWGTNFDCRERTLIVDISRSDEEIAGEVVEFLERAKRQPRSIVPSWSQVVDLYVKELYS